jgi:hypothetical protein
MMVLILIVTQIVFIVGILGLILHLTDRIVDAYKLRLSFGRKNKFTRKSRKSRIPHQLLILVNFDTPTAERLMNHVKLKYPGKSDRWYTEKVIHDLERDRH